MSITLDLGGNDLRVNSISTGYGTPQAAQGTRSQAAGSTYTASATNVGETILLDTAAGSTVTLPAATGTGNIYRFLVSAVATSNSHIVKVASASDVMKGFAVFADTDGTAAVNAFMTVHSGTLGTNSDTITLNRSTTGSVTVGEYIEVQDYATGLWRVMCLLSNTGTPTTPFSAAV